MGKHVGALDGSMVFCFFGFLETRVVTGRLTRGVAAFATNALKPFLAFIG
jgi:hypothetical protein